VNRVVSRSYREDRAGARQADLQGTPRLGLSAHRAVGPTVAHQAGASELLLDPGTIFHKPEAGGRGNHARPRAAVPAKGTGGPERISSTYSRTQFERPMPLPSSGDGCSVSNRN